MTLILSLIVAAFLCFAGALVYGMWQTGPALRHDQSVAERRSGRATP